ncbi:MAG: TIR domain-containing protein [Chloroflexi bacterium]|nr:TIR domain-containing protein [Chloroflexota bacterium]
MSLPDQRTVPTLDGVEVFYSYSHQDKKHRGQLQKHLAMLRRQGLIREWHDRQIGAGEEWRGAIDTHIETAQIILLLVSSDFLDSHYCYDVEMARALQRHVAGEARVIPIILRPCDWQAAPLANLQALPTDGKPVTMWANRDSAFLDIATGIRKAVNEILERPPRAGQPAVRPTSSPSVTDHVASPLGQVGPNLPMQPGICPGQTPPFHELGADVFQAMCRDVLAYEPGIATSDIYGTSGQTQHGIDTLARRRHDGGVEVAQCKAYARFTVANLRSASDEFLGHWEETWSKRNVRRFVLIVACDLDTTQLQDEVSAQFERFAAYGVTYEAWSSTTLRVKLHPHPSIVGAYCSPAWYWVQEICGVQLSAPVEVSRAVAPGGLVPPDVSAQLVELASIYSKEISERIETMRAATREGKKRDALSWLHQLKGDSAQWAALDAITKAKVLRFEASLELEVSDDAARATALAHEARQLAPGEDDSTIRALIAFRAEGAIAAAELLAGRDTADALNLRALFVLDLGELDQARGTLERIDAVAAPNAETFRLWALMHLLERDIDQARLSAQKSVELAPTWATIRVTAAMIDYFSAVSPLALPGHLVGWPEPVHWALVRRDDHSVARLRSAAHVFGQLAALPDLRVEQRRSYETWQLACLANDPERQAQAAALCCSLLNADPTHYPVLAWAVARRFSFDLAPVAAAMNALIADGMASVGHVVALSSALIAMGEPRQALEALNATRDLFAQHQATDSWLLLHMQARLALPEAEESLPEVDQIGDEEVGLRARALALLRRARETGEWQPVISYMLAGYDRLRDPVLLYQACELLAEQGDWARVADRADWLVNEISTADALRLAAIAAFNSGRFRQSLQLLDAHRGFFPNAELPIDLRRARVECLSKLGVVSEAITEAQEIVEENPTTDSLLTLAQLHLSKGDLKAASVVAQRILGQPDLTAIQSLQVSRWTRLDDALLAAQCWKKALDLGVPDDAVGEAIALGFELGLEAEMRPLLNRMTQLATEGRGGIRAASLQELVAHIRRQRERSEELDRIYRSGNVPIHLVAEALGMPLVDLFHLRLVEHAAAPDPLRQLPLLIRHGGRGPVPDFRDGAPEWRLNADVTALLLAAHLDLLDAVEAGFAPIRIPRPLITTFVQMRDRLANFQASRVEVWRLIDRLLADGAIKVVQPAVPSSGADPGLVAQLGEDWVALYELACAHNGFVVDFLPLTRVDASGIRAEVPATVLAHVVNLRAIVDALRRQGPLSRGEHQRLLESLGDQGREIEGGVVPQQSAVLYCDVGIAEELASKGILEEVCRRFRVHVDQRTVTHARESLREVERRSVAAHWLDRIISRLSSGIGAGTYTQLPAPALPTEAETKPWDEPSIQCLLTLLQFEPEVRDAIWIDDRYSTSYGYRGVAQIVGIVEILKALVARGRMDMPTYYERLHRLRAANIRFIPVEAEEIVHHLQQATVEEGHVVETEALAVLRCYVAATLLQSDILQKPPLPQGAPNPAGENAVALGLGRAINDALRALWASPHEDEGAQDARAEWLLGSLYLDHHGLVRVSGLPLRDPNTDDRYLAGVGLAGLISQAVGLGPESKTDQPRKRYLDWIWERIVALRTAADPILLAGIGDVLRGVIASARDDAKAERLGPPAAQVLRDFYREMPEPIQQELHKDAELLASIGVGLSTAVRLGDLWFEPDEFWSAVSEAVNGREAVVTPVQMKNRVRFMPRNNLPGTAPFWFVHPTTGERTPSRDEFELLHDSPSHREAVLRRHLDWFELPTESSQRLVAEIASMESPRQRVETAIEWHEASALMHYRRIFRKVRAREEFTYDELLPPSPDGLLRHFGFALPAASELPFGEVLDQAARALLGSIGPKGALERLTGLPVPLSDALIDAIAALPPADRRSIIKGLTVFQGSPPSRIHLLRLLVRFAEDNPAYARLARRIVRASLSEEGEEAFATFAAVLGWADHAFARWSGARAWPTRLRLAMVWAHTHVLFVLFRGTGATLEWLRDAFEHAPTMVPAEMFQSDQEYRWDIATPRRLRRTRFVLAGLAYAIPGSTETFLDDPHLRRLLAETVLVESEGQVVPHPMLLEDFTHARNALGSFLTAPYWSALVSVLGDAVALMLAPESLQAIGVRTASNLATNNADVRLWLDLRFLIGDLPQGEELSSRLRSIIRESDFVSLVREDAKRGLIAFHTAALQAIHLDDDGLCQRLANQVPEVARARASSPQAEGGSSSPVEAGNLALLLLDATRNISLALAESGADVVGAFAGITADILVAWPAASVNYQPVIQRCCEELPVSMTGPLWSVLERIRASSAVPV